MQLPYICSYSYLKVIVNFANIIEKSAVILLG